MRNAKSHILEGTPLISGPPTIIERGDKTAHLKRNVVKSSNLATLTDKEVMSCNKPSTDHLQRTDGVPTKTGNPRESKHISFRGTKYDTVYVGQSSPSLQESETEAELVTKSEMESTAQAYSASKFQNVGRESGYAGRPASSFGLARGVTKEEQLRLVEIRRAKLLSRIHELLTNVDQQRQPRSTAATAEHTELSKLYPAKEDLIVPRVANYWNAKSAHIEEGRKLLKARRGLHVIRKSKPPAMPVHYRKGSDPQAKGEVIKCKTSEDKKNIIKTDKSTEIDELDLEDDQYICHGQDKAVQTQFIKPRQRRRFSDAVEITVRMLSRPSYTMKVVADENGLRAVREDVKTDPNRASLAVGPDPEPQLRHKGLQPVTTTDENPRNKRVSSTIEMFIKPPSTTLNYMQSLRASEVPKKEQDQYKDGILHEANRSVDLIQASTQEASGEDLLELSDYKWPEKSEVSVPVMHNLRSSFGTLVSVDAQPSHLEKTAVDESGRGDKQQPQEKKAASLSGDFGPISERTRGAELDFPDYKRFETGEYTSPVDRLLTQPHGEAVASHGFERSQGDKMKFGEFGQDSNGLLRQLVGDIRRVAEPEGHGEDIPSDRLVNKQSETEESPFSLERDTTPDFGTATESPGYQLPKAETTDVYQLGQEDGDLLQEAKVMSPTGITIAKPKLDDHNQESVLASSDRKVSEPSESAVSLKRGLLSPSESSAMVHDSRSSEMERTASYEAEEESNDMPREPSIAELTDTKQDFQHLETSATPASDQTAPASNESNEVEMESDKQGEMIASTALAGEPDYTTISVFDDEF